MPQTTLRAKLTQILEEAIQEMRGLTEYKAADEPTSDYHTLLTKKHGYTLQTPAKGGFRGMDATYRHKDGSRVDLDRNFWTHTNPKGEEKTGRRSESSMGLDMHLSGANYVPPKGLSMENPGQRLT